MMIEDLKQAVLGGPAAGWDQVSMKDRVGWAPMWGRESASRESAGRAWQRPRVRRGHACELV